MIFLDPAQMNTLTERLLQASQHMSDPASEVQIALAEVGVLPEGVRAEVEAENIHLKLSYICHDRQDASEAIAAVNRIFPGPRLVADHEKTEVIDFDEILAAHRAH